MEKEVGLDHITHNPASVVTVGTFDGVHRGHQEILDYLIQRARVRQGTSVVVTFDPHPREVVTGEPVELLSTIEERMSWLSEAGIDRCVVIPFTRDFSKLSPEAFVEQILVERVGMQEIVIGYDHGFGKGREGDSALLETLGQQLGFSVDIIPAQSVDHQIISSSKIRHHLVDTGDVGQAAEMLGRPYMLRGKVVPGDGRGRTIGVPTANIEPLHERKIIPRQGVYAVLVRVDGEKTVLGGMMNIGVRPTFGGRERVMEVHLFDFEGDLYEKILCIEFVSRIRDEQRFSGVEALKEQLSRDQARCRKLLQATI